MTKTIATNVIVVSVNHVDGDVAQEMAEENGFDSIDEYAASLEESVEAIVAHRLFGDADAIPIIDISTDVYDDWDEGDVKDLRVGAEDE